MKKVTLILMVSLLCILTGNLMAQTTVVVDQTGTDFQNFWKSPYCLLQNLGKG
jgi:hypothetical protein